MTGPAGIDLRALRRELTERARALGFDALGVASIDIPEDERHLLKWLNDGFHGEMHYMRSAEHTSELQSQSNLVCRLLLEKKKTCCCTTTGRRSRRYPLRLLGCFRRHCAPSRPH